MFRKSWCRWRASDDFFRDGIGQRECPHFCANECTQIELSQKLRSLPAVLPMLPCRQVLVRHENWDCHLTRLLNYTLNSIDFATKNFIICIYLIQFFAVGFYCSDVRLCYSSISRFFFLYKHFEVSVYFLVGFIFDFSIRLWRRLLKNLLNYSTVSGIKR